MKRVSNAKATATIPLLEVFDLAPVHEAAKARGGNYTPSSSATHSIPQRLAASLTAAINSVRVVEKSTSRVNSAY
jgi:hypothetical protein